MRKLIAWVLVQILLLVSTTSFGASSFEQRIKSGDKQAVLAGYKKYLTSTNAANRQSLREALQSSLDVTPATLLDIKGINVEAFCDGEDIDQASGTDAVLMRKRTAVRLKKVQAAKVADSVKGRCIAGLERFITCTQGNC